MRQTARTAAAAAVLGLACALVTPVQAWADDPPAEPTVAQQDPPIMHNVTYRARADGTSRGAVVAYKADDHNVNSEQPTILPGQTFEVNTVLSDPKLAGMELTIDWPYGSNLHCEILVDDQIVAQADQFIAPRLLRPKDDPLYGTIQCGTQLNNAAGGVIGPGNTVDTDPVDVAPVEEPAPEAPAA